jgi:hypothetical protein
MKFSFGNINIEGNYSIFRFWEIGAYLGYSRRTSMGAPSLSSEEFLFENHNVPYFGLNTNLHLLSPFFKTSYPKIDLYLKARYGGPLFHSVSDMYYPSNGFNPDFGFGAGAAFYFKNNKLGIFTEYEYEKKEIWINYPKILMKYGLTYRF